jgi:hypothetical protein
MGGWCLRFFSLAGMISTFVFLDMGTSPLRLSSNGNTLCLGGSKLYKIWALE